MVFNSIHDVGESLSTEVEIAVVKTLFEQLKRTQNLYLSRIGILLPDDSILSVYHHFDGYPEWLGVTLEEHFNTYEKASELIDGGNMGRCYSDSE